MKKILDFFQRYPTFFESTCRGMLIWILNLLVFRFIFTCSYGHYQIQRNCGEISFFRRESSYRESCTYRVAPLDYIGAFLQRATDFR